MITFTRTSRVILIAGAALALVVPTAAARPIVLRPSPVATSTPSYQGTYRPAVNGVQVAPDVQDRVGTVNQATGIHPLPVATTLTVSKSSFDWSAAAVGAGSVAAIALLGAGVLGFRGRRRMALGV